MSRLGRALAVTGWVGLGIVVLYGLAVLVLLAHTPVAVEEWFRPRPRKSFSREVWQSTRFGDPDRYRMANDLVWSGRLLGMTEPEVKDLLGPETSEDRYGAKTVVGYDLVSQRQFPAKSWLLPSFLFLNTDTWLLELEIAGGKVRRVKIRFT